MVKKMVLVGRRDGLDAEGFAQHWQHNHAPLAAGVIGRYLSSGPGGARYVQNHVLSVLWVAASSGVPYRADGVASFDVDPADPPPEARSSPEFGVLLADEKRFIGIWTQCVVAREGTDAEPAAGRPKILVVGDRHAGLADDTFRAAVRTAWSDRPQRATLCFNWVSQTMRRDGLASEEFAPDCLVEAWLDDDAPIAAAVACARRMQEGCKRVSALLVREHRVL